MPRDIEEYPCALCGDATATTTFDSPAELTKRLPRELSGTLTGLDVVIPLCDLCDRNLSGSVADLRDLRWPEDTAEISEDLERVALDLDLDVVRDASPSRDGRGHLG